MAVKIKLKRLGKIRAPYYRIVVADARTKRDGRAIEEIGKYHPKSDPSFIEVDSERAQHWLSVGAQPTDPVRKILEITGDWQKYKGLPGAEGTLRMPEPKADRKAAFAAALQENLESSGATTPKSGGKGRSKPDTAKSDTAKSDTAKDSAKSDTAKSDTAKAESGKPAKARTDSDKPGKASAEKASTEKEAAPETEPAEAAASAESGSSEG